MKTLTKLVTKTHLTIASLILTSCTVLSPVAIETNFDGEQAYNHVSYQVSLGPRIPGSEAHEQTVTWIRDRLIEYGWQVEIQEGENMGHPIKNVIGRKGSGDPWLILGAHYDTRIIADQDPNPAKRDEPVLGANDGASGVAVLIELARILSIKKNQGQIWLVFFDAEDNGNIQGWDWILGSEFFVEKLNGEPDDVVILDMIGDKDLNIYKDRYSSFYLIQGIWQQAEELGYSDHFIPEYKYFILDDHTPFLKRGIHAVDVIDFDYPYWHTTEDTLDKVSPESLRIVGDTIYHWTNDYFD